MNSPRLGSRQIERDVPDTSSDVEENDMLDPRTEFFEAPRVRLQSNEIRVHDPRARLQSNEIRVHDPRARLQSNEIRVYDPRARLQSNEIRVYDPRARLQSNEIRVYDPRARLQSNEIRVYDPRARLQSNEIRVYDPRARLQSNEARVYDPRARLQIMEIRIYAPRARIQSNKKTMFVPLTSMPLTRFYAPENYSDDEDDDYSIRPKLQTRWTDKKGSELFHHTGDSSLSEWRRSTLILPERKLVLGQRATQFMCNLAPLPGELATILDITYITNWLQRKLGNMDCLTLESHDTIFGGSVSTFSDGSHAGRTIHFVALCHIEVDKCSGDELPVVAWLEMVPNECQEIMERHLMHHVATVLQRQDWLTNDAMTDIMRAFQHLDQYFDFKRRQLDLSDKSEERAGVRDPVILRTSTSPPPPPPPHSL